jgi:hypothetical protein
MLKFAQSGRFRFWIFALFFSLQFVHRPSNEWSMAADQSSCVQTVFDNFHFFIPGTKNPKKCSTWIMAHVFVLPQPEWLNVRWDHCLQRAILNFTPGVKLRMGLCRLSPTLLRNNNQRGLQTLGRRSDGHRLWTEIKKIFPHIGRPVSVSLLT